MGSFQLYQTGTKMKSERWRTQVEEIPRMAFIGPSETIFSMGSCFSDYMAAFLSERKMEVTANPFGIIYNPVAMQKLMQRVVDANYFSVQDIFEYRGLYRSLESHSVCSDTTEEGALRLLNEAIDKSKESLSNAKLVLLTFGTSLVHIHKEQNKVVANNHALPAAAFLQKQLTTEEVQRAIEKITSAIHSVNPNATIILTLSPVRHIRSGLVANARSKAVLLEATHQIVDKYNFCNYFPAYEYVIDELRDYRFYKEDMVHPSDMAVQFVWERFVETSMATDTIQFLKDMEVLLAAKQHRILHPGTEESQLFIANQLANITRLRQKYPFLNLDTEEQHFHSLSSS